MVLQAFIDESYSKKHFVLAGHVASAESWAKFTREWEDLLPHGGTLANNGRYHFHMTDMAANTERMSRVPAFYWIIEKYAAVSISYTLNFDFLRRAKARIWIPDTVIDWGFLDDPYLVSWWTLLDLFHEKKEMFDGVIPTGDKVDFIFDRLTTNEKLIQEIWDDFLKFKPASVRGRFGANPRFEDDQDFVPLQAADFWAWWVRKWRDEGAPERVNARNFGAWRSRSPFPNIVMQSSEDQLVRTLIDMITPQMARIDPRRPIFDSNVSPRQS